MIDNSAKFEVDLTEPLTGWRAWLINNKTESNGIVRPGLYSTVALNMPQCVWHPDQPMMAVCLRNNLKHPPDDFSGVPAVECGCGLYAMRTFQAALSNMGMYTPSIIVYGEVYGWGKYILGTNGWRAQYAYPKSFHVYNGGIPRANYAALRDFHVPIYDINSGNLVYNPEEDGYANRGKGENRNSRAVRDTLTAEGWTTRYLYGTIITNPYSTP